MCRHQNDCFVILMGKIDHTHSHRAHTVNAENLLEFYALKKIDVSSNPRLRLTHRSQPADMDSQAERRIDPHAVSCTFGNLTGASHRCFSQVLITGAPSEKRILYIPCELRVSNHFYSLLHNVNLCTVRRKKFRSRLLKICTK